MSFKFPSAADSKSASELKALHTEICAIETAILDARCEGERSVTICDTPFATSTAHYDAFQNFQGKNYHQNFGTIICKKNLFIVLLVIDAHSV